jgi:hypothetical protein
VSSFTLATLKAAVESWVEDAGADFEGDFATMLALAEDRALKDLDLSLFDAEQALTLNSDVITKLPVAAVVATRYLYIASLGRFLYPRQVAYIRMRHGATTGVPKDYADYTDTQYLIGPIPNISYSALAMVMKRPNSLATDSSGTFLSTRAGDVLFRSCLIQAADYLQMDERLQTLEAEYGRALSSSQYELRHLRRRDYSPFAPQPSAVGKPER